MASTSISILGSGWLGLPLAERLGSRGHAIKLSTTRTSRLEELGKKKFAAYVIQIDELDDAVDDFLQAEILICNITSKSIDGFINLLRHVEKSSIEKLLFVSSTSVYMNANEKVSESDGLESSASPLLAIEKLFTNSDGFQTTILRFAGLVGYNRNPANFFRPGRLMRDPEAPVNLIHRDDCIDIIERIIDGKAWGETFNACADTHPKKIDFYRHVARQCGLPEPEIAPQTVNDYKIISNQKLKDVLHYQFKHADLMKIPFC